MKGWLVAVGVAVATMQLVGCDSSKGSPSEAPSAGGSQPAKAASAPATAAAAAAPKCPDDKATLHTNPAYCITVPAGFTYKDEPFDRETYAKFTKDGAEITTKFSKDPGDAKYYDQQKDLEIKGIKDDKDNTVLEEGKLPGDKGVFIVYEKKNKDRWVSAIAKSNKRLFKCSVYDPKKVDALIAACKSLTPLDE